MDADEEEQAPPDLPEQFSEFERRIILDFHAAANAPYRYWRFHPRILNRLAVNGMRAAPRGACHATPLRGAACCSKMWPRVPKNIPKSTQK